MIKNKKLLQAAAAALLCMACNNTPTQPSVVYDTLFVPDTSYVHPDPENAKPLFDDSDGVMAKFFEEQGYVWTADFERLAWDGDIDAMRILSNMYAYGIGGVRPNRTTAFFLFRELANRGDIEGMRNAGYMMLYGIGPLEDFEAGKEMLSNAANHDDALAWYLLGNFHNYNLKHDAEIVAKAKLYYQNAIRLGFKAAEEELRSMQ